MLSAVYRFQAGANYARTLSVSAPASCACTFSAAAAAGSVPTQRHFARRLRDAVQRVPAGQHLGDRPPRREDGERSATSPKVRLFLDGFNLTNTYAAETINTSAGATFQQPTAILGPRTGRVGFRFIW